jgi:hypothetical protein
MSPCPPLVQLDGRLIRTVKAGGKEESVASEFDCYVAFGPL